MELFSYISIVVLLAITPGADMALIMKNTISYHKQGGVFTVFGVCSGLLVHGTLSASGLSLLIIANKTIFFIIRYLGALYLIYLGFVTLKNIWHDYKQQKHYTAPETQSLKPKSYEKLFMEGFLTNVLNPKVLVMFLSIIPQFMRVDASFLDIFILAFIPFIISFGWLYSYCILLHVLRNFINRIYVKRSLQFSTGIVMVLLGLKMLSEG